MDNMEAVISALEEARAALDSLEAELAAGGEEEGEEPEVPVPVMAGKPKSVPPVA